MNIKPAKVKQETFKRICLLVLPTVLMTTAAIYHAANKPDVWSAYQGLILRDEVNGEFSRLGRFESTDAMQTAEETVMEIARHPSVVGPALKALGPPMDSDDMQRFAFSRPFAMIKSLTSHAIKTSAATGAWPTPTQIEAARRHVTISSPQGAQFGRTELIYLSVVEEAPERAVEFTRQLCDRLEERLKLLRNERYSNIVLELTKTVKLAEQALDASTSELQNMEKKIGPDLVELRVMIDSGTGSGTLRRTLNDVAGELRQAKAIQVEQTNNRQQLIEAQSDPNQLVSTHNELVFSFSALQRIKAGLVDAQLRTAQLQGTRNDEHPDVQAVLIAEMKVKLQIRDELSAALRGLDANLDVSSKRIEELQRQTSHVNSRLAQLADVRAPYSKLMADVDARTSYLDSVRHDLSEAQANQTVSENVSLLTRVDEPVLSAEPEGPGRASIVGIGLAAGLATGCGLVYLLAPIPRQASTTTGEKSTFRLRMQLPSALSRVGRRASDFFHRRETDGGGGRRQTDVQSESKLDDWGTQRDPHRDQNSGEVKSERPQSAAGRTTD